MPPPLRRSGFLLTPTVSSSMMSGPAVTNAALVLISWSLLIGGSTLLVARRLAGAFDSSLAVAALAVVGLLLALLAHAARVSIPAEWLVRQPLGWRALLSSVGVSLAAFGAMGVSLPGTSPLGLVWLWCPLLFEGASVLRDAYSHVAAPTRAPLVTLMANALADRPRGRAASTTRPRSSQSRDSRPKTEPTQSLVRWMAGDSDSLRGRVLVRLAVGRRTASAHVAFCPPFAETPTVRIKPGTRAGLDVSVGQVLPHGARFDVKLGASSTKEMSVPIEFNASGPAIEST